MHIFVFALLLKTAQNDLKNAIVKLKKEKDLEGLILDLRNNPGGLLNESVDIVNLFVEKGEEVVSTKGRKYNLGTKLTLQIKTR